MDQPLRSQPASPNPKPSFDPTSAIGVVLLVVAMGIGWMLAGGLSGSTGDEIAMAPTTAVATQTTTPAMTTTSRSLGTGGQDAPPASQPRLRPPRWLPETTATEVPPTFATATVVTTTIPAPTTTLPWGSGTVRSGPTELAPSLTTAQESQLRLVADQSDAALHELFIPGCGGMSQGTGWAIDRHHVVTNAHVVAVGGAVALQGRDGVQRRGVVIGRFDDLDVAVVQVEESLPQSLRWAEPGSFDTGDGLVILGWPRNSWRVTTGVVQHMIRENGQLNAVLTDASVDHGNSGGPVLDRTGRVIGVVTLGVTVPGRPQIGMFGLAYTEDAHGAAVAQAIASPSEPTPSCTAFGR